MEVLKPGKNTKLNCVSTYHRTGATRKSTTQLSKLQLGLVQRNNAHIHM